MSAARTDEAFTAFRAARRFPALDGLRAIAILGVLWHHTAGEGSRGLLAHGNEGVQLFFAISGFLITTLLLRERDRDGAIDLRAFYRRRTLRIFPVYYVVLGLYAALVFATARATDAGHEFFHNVPAFVTYTSNWFIALDGGQRVIFYFAWSLATEEQFYLFWPPILRFVPRGTLAPALVAALFAIDGSVEAAASLGALDAHTLFVRVATSPAGTICLGTLLALALHERRGFGVVYRVLGHRVSPFVVASALVGAFAVPNMPHIVIDALLAALVGSVSVRSGAVLDALLANRVARHIGAVSYGMYLVHMLVANVVRRVLMHVPIHASAVAFIATAVVSIGVASVSYRWFERPLQDRFAGRRRLLASAAATQSMRQPALAHSGS